MRILSETELLGSDCAHSSTTRMLHRGLSSAVLSIKTIVEDQEKRVYNVSSGKHFGGTCLERSGVVNGNAVPGSSWKF